MHMDLRHPVADHGQVEGVRHAGDLEPWRDAAATHLIDHHDIDRPRFHHVAERYNPPEVFATGNRRRKRSRHAGEPGKIVRSRYVLEPKEPDPGVFDPLTDIDRLLDPPALVDVAHQIHVGADRLA